jgi:hypothetical protein
MTIEDWLASACADADRRGLPGLKPLLSALADATRALRAEDWHDSLAATPPAGPSATRGLKTPGSTENPDADAQTAQSVGQSFPSGDGHARRPRDGAAR